MALSSRHGSRTALVTSHGAFIALMLLILWIARSTGSSPFTASLLSQIAVLAIALIGLSMLYGWSGQLSLGHAAFVGLGAYTTAILRPITAQMFGGAALDLVAVLLVSLVAGLVVGLPALRVSGIQLVVITLGFAEVFSWSLSRFSSLSGGTQGLIVTAPTLGPLSFGSPDERAVLSVLAAGLIGALVLIMSKSKIAITMFTVRDSPLAAESVGIDIREPQLLAFVLSAAIAGASGWLMAYADGFVIPGNFTLFDNVFLLVGVIIGGRGSVAGAWVGAAFLVLLPELSRTVLSGRLYPVIAGSALVVIALLLPSGIVPGIRTGSVRVWRRARAGWKASRGEASS